VFFFSKRARAMPTEIELSAMVGQKTGTRAL
jgi:hypothetical protein